MARRCAGRRSGALRPRNAFLEFARQQPLGAVSFFVIAVMMFAGIFSERVAPYDPLNIDSGVRASSGPKELSKAT